MILSLLYNHRLLDTKLSIIYEDIIISRKDIDKKRSFKTTQANYRNQAAIQILRKVLRLTHLAFIYLKA